MSDAGGDSDPVWAAGELGSALRGDLDDLDVGPVDDLARIVDDPHVIGVMSRVATAYQRHDDEKAFHDTRLYGEMLRRHGNQTASRALEQGNPSRIQGLTGLVDHSTDANEAMLELLDELTRDAFTCFIGGGQNSGKTNCAMYLAEWWETGIKQPGTIVSNIPVDVPGTIELEASDDIELRERESGSRVHLDDVHDYRSGELELRVDGNRVDVTGARVVIAYRETHVRRVAAAVEGRALMVLDEWGTAGGGDKGSDANAATEMLRFLRAIRKEPILGSMLAIGHADTDANADLRAMLDFAITKTKQQIKHADVWRHLTSDGGEGRITTIRDIPETRLRYPSARQPTFLFDGGEDDGEGLSKDEQIARAQALRDTGWDSEDIADDAYIEYGPRWVRDKTEAPDDREVVPVL